MSFTPSLSAQESASPDAGKLAAVNIGYLLFAAGVIWLGVTAAWEARGNSARNCRYESVCSDATPSAPKELQIGLADTRTEAGTILAKGRV